MFLFLSNPNEKIFSYFLSLFFEAESALVQTRSSCCCVRIRERETRFDVDAIILYLFFIFFFLLLSDDKEETVLFCFVCFRLLFVCFSLIFLWKKCRKTQKGAKGWKKAVGLFCSLVVTRMRHISKHTTRNMFSSLSMRSALVGTSVPTTSTNSRGTRSNRSLRS